MAPPPETLLLPDPGGVRLQDLLSRTPWIRGLARSLVQDEHLIDDIVQETIAAALRSPPDDPLRLRPWLRTVTRNFARLAFRERSRRRSREERAAREDRTASHEGEVDLEDQRRLVAEHVADLDEPYRSTVLEIFYRNRSVKEMARREGVPENTVRVRKKRALEILRLRMTPEGDHRRRRAVSGLLLFAHLPQETLDQVMSGGLSATAPAPSTSAEGSRTRSPEERAPQKQEPPFTGRGDRPGDRGDPVPLPARARPVSREAPTSRRSRLAGSAAATLLIAILAWLALPDDGAPEATRRSVAAGDRPSSGASVADRGAGTGTVQGPAAARVPSVRAPSNPAPITPGEHRIRIVDAVDGHPIAGAEVRLDLYSMRSTDLARGRSAVEYLLRPFARRPVGETDAAGELAVPRGLLARERLQVVAPGYALWREPARHRHLGADPQDAWIVRLAPLSAADSSTITFLGPDDRPLADLPVEIEDGDGGVQTLRTGAAGVIELPWQRDDLAIAVTAPGLVATRCMAERPRQVVRLAAGEPGRGEVLDRFGRPIADCDVWIGCRPHWPGPRAHARTDQGGGFETLPLASSGVVELEIRHAGFAPLRATVELPWGEARAFELADGAVVDGRIAVPAGSVPAGAEVTLVPRSGSFRARDLPSTAVGEDGAFTLAGLPSGDHALRVDHPELAPLELDLPILRPGERLFRSLALETGRSCEILVVDPGGRPVSGVRATVGGVFGDEIRGRDVVSDARGLLAAAGLPERDPVVRGPARELRLTAAHGRERALLVEVLPPHELLAVDGVPVPSQRFLGSRNTALLTSSDGAPVLTVAAPETCPLPPIHLVALDGSPIRTLTNLFAIPIDEPSGASGLFAGSTGNPVMLEDPRRLAGSLVGFWTRPYGLAYARLPTVDDAVEVILEPAPPARTLRLLDDRSRPLAGEPVLFTPLFPGESAPPVAILLGLTDSRGDITVDRLAPCRARIAIARDPASLRDGRPGMAALRTDDVEFLGFIVIGGPASGIIEMRLDHPRSVGTERP